MALEPAVRDQLRRTHTWGDAPFTWGEMVLAANVSDDGSVASSIHRDESWIEWNIATGARQRLVARCGDLLRATFTADGEAALVMMAPRLKAIREVETIERASGTRRPHPNPLRRA